MIGYRVKHHLTQSQLAEKLGVRQPQVVRLEMGEHTPSLEMLQRLARTLGLRFIAEVAPAGVDAPASALALPAGVESTDQADPSVPTAETHVVLSGAAYARSFREEVAAGRALGTARVPFAFLDRRYAFVGVQSVEGYATAIRTALREAA